MPGLRRRYARRPRVMRRKRFAPRRRLNRTTRIPRVYNFKRTLFLENSVSVLASTGLPFSSHYGFTLGMLPSASDFTNLYDEYRINKVVFKIIPKFSQVLSTSGSGTSILTQVHTAIDYDDSLALPTGTALSEITQYQTHKMSRGNAIHQRVVVPKCELSVGGSTSAPKALQWIDCDNTSILHNGIKVVVPKLLQTGTEQYWDVQMDVYMSFRNVV